MWGREGLDDIEGVRCWVVWVKWWMVCGIRPWAGDEPETGTGSSCHVRYDVRPAAALRESPLLFVRMDHSIVYIANTSLSRTFILLPIIRPTVLQPTMHWKCPAVDVILTVLNIGQRISIDQFWICIIDNRNLFYIHDIWIMYFLYMYNPTNKSNTHMTFYHSSNYVTLFFVWTITKKYDIS